MAKISGVSVELITKLGGVSKQLVRKLGGKLTAELGFGPDYNPGPFCDQIFAYYHETSLQTAYQKFLDALEGTEIYIEFDRDNNFFYQEGQCGQNDSYATTGYYVFDFGKGEIAYFYWNGATQTLTPQEPPAAGPTNSTSITVSERRSSYSGNTLIPLTPGVDFEITAQRIDTLLNTSDIVNPQFAHNFILRGDRGSWSGTGNLSYTYKWYIDNTLVNTSGPWPQFNPKTGEMEDYTTPEYSFDLSTIGTTIKFEVIVTDDNGTTTESVLIPVTDPTLNTYLSNTGITDPTTISALKYLRQEMLTPRANYSGPYEPGAFYILESLLIDYYPIAGNTRDQHKWSMKNPNYTLQFEGNLVGSRPSYWEHTSAGMYSTDTSNSNNNIISEYSANYYATSNSASIGFAFGVFSNTKATIENQLTEANVTAVARLENPDPGLDGFSYYPRYLDRATQTGRAFGTYQVNPFTPGTTKTWYIGGLDQDGLSGLIIRDGTNFSNLGNASNIYGDIIISGSVYTPNGSTIHDLFITQSNQFATPSYNLLIHGNQPLNIQFIYSSKLPMYKESPFYTFGPQSFVTHLSNTIKTYNAMLGR